MSKNENRVNRLRHAVEAEGGAASFAKKYDVDASYISQILNGHRAFGEKAARKMEARCKLPGDWFDETTQVDQNTRPAPPDTRRIPVLSKIPAGGPKQIIDDYLTGAGMDDIATDLKLGRYAFALIIDGPSMEPEFKTGDKVIIDPDVRPHPGECVAAKCNGDEGTFKKYRPRGQDTRGVEVFELVPLNEDYPIIRSDQMEIEIIGTMVEHRKYRRVR